MRRLLSMLLLLVLTILPQACQRDEATGPQPAALSAQAMGVFASRIAFTSTRDGGLGDIYVMNADGSAPTRLTDAPRSNTQPSWSPDGRQIAFTGRRRPPIGVDNFYDIFVMNADGSGQTQLTHNGIPDVGNANPTWSPDGQRIAFTHTAHEIYVVNADGSGEMRLTQTAELQRDPDWSPDGRQIAFEGFAGNASQVYVMNADGSAPRQLTNTSGGNREPTWSPHGRQIAFTSDRDGNTEIYVMNADGSSQNRVTDNPATDASPTWSPDGRQIAFTSNRDGNFEIYVMNTDGSSQTRLTNDPAADVEPAWSPKVPSRAPAQLVFTTQPPATVSVDVAISPAVQVTVTDASGDPVPGGAVRLAIGTSPSANATLSGTTIARIVNGVATFTDVRIDRVGQGYTLLAEAGPVSATSAAFAVVGPGTPLPSPSR